ncbi:putative vacuolar sorting protein [Lineolata rhizophorae]|uniref:Putative vacuolar sorting protein n=1 Tax=Lineolata rhizophorae TaxID=578093 RepID=A0A6A6NLR0_9PEZI|nr:putative vacuolar sorting protein [Lineolata rhizophorae]
MAPLPVLSTADTAATARRDLLQLLEGVRGKKNLVVERALAAPLGLFVKFSTLQEYGVDRVYFLENDNVDTSQRNVVFLVRGEKVKAIHSVADQIRRVRSSSQIDHEFSVFWVPRRTLVSDFILEEAGVLGEANVTEYPLYFMPLADDVLSLELDDAFSDLYLRKDPSCIYLAAKALMDMQQRHGLFPRIIGKGDNAKRLADLLIRMRSEVTAAQDLSNGGSSVLGLTPSQSIENLIIIDREVDFPTVLLTQLTYEGLIDEVFGISSNQAEVSSSIVGNPSQQQQSASSSTSPASQSLKRKIQLDASSDALYSTLRDSNFAVMKPVLQKVARRLQSSYEARHAASKTVAELRDFVAKLPGYQAEQASLKLHTNLAEEIIKYTGSDMFTRILEVQQHVVASADPATQHDNVDELIARAAPLHTLLRLVCLESCVGAGLKPSYLDAIKRTILHAYGPQHLLTLTALEKMGLLTPRAGGLASSIPAAKPGSVTNFPAARKSLGLIVEDVNEADPDDVAYVYSGYAPLSVRLVQCILQKRYVAALTKAPAGVSQAAAAAEAGVKGGVGVGGAGGGSVGWRPFEEAVRLVRGVGFDEVQTGEERAVRARQILNGHGSSTTALGGVGTGGSAATSVPTKTVVVFFLGGVCRAEVAALRFLAKKLADEGRPRRIVVATTGVVSGDRVVGAAVEGDRFGGGSGSGAGRSG